MNNFVKSIIFTVFLISTLTVDAQKSSNSKFFTRSDKDNWEYITSNKNIDASSLFEMNDGVLKVSDGAVGYLRTKKLYANFSLKVEYRWTKVLANSGVLVHIQPRDSIWPVCFQVQLKTEAAGDIICMNGLQAKECVDKLKFTVPKYQPSNEKPLGEWNELIIKSQKGEFAVYVNGLLQNKISKLSVKNGYIGFQAEGKPLELKNLSIK